MQSDNTLLQVTNYGMGQGDQELGLQLFGNYIKLCLEDNQLPKIIALYNAGVKLIATGSPVIDILKEAEAKGTKIIACKTCLNHYGLIDKVQVGIGGTMIDIITLQSKASKVITL